MKWIDYDFVIKAQQMNVNKFGGLHGIRDKELINSCIETPLSTFEGQHLYETIEEKISECCYLFCKNHCFNDGNKRIGISILLYLCIVNDIKLKYTQNELIALGLGIADGSYDKEYIKEWIINHRG